jgi:hypothetical protein
MEGACEYGNEPSGPIIDREFNDLSSINQLLSLVIRSTRAAGSTLCTASVTQ